MPEGPEVKVLANYLNGIFKNSNISSIDINEQKSFSGDAMYIDMKLPAQITTIYSIAKALCFTCVQNDDESQAGIEFIIFITFGLVGEISIGNDKSSSANVILTTDKGTINYIDKLKFGRVSVLSPSEYRKKIAKFGIDITSTDIVTFIDFIERKLKRLRSEWEIGDWMLEQGVFAGVGNYIRSDAMHLAKIDPCTLVSELTDEDWINLIKCIKSVMNNSFNAQIKKLYGDNNATPSSPIKYTYNTLKKCYKYIAYNNPDLRKIKMKKSKRFVWTAF